MTVLGKQMSDLFDCCVFTGGCIWQVFPDRLQPWGVRQHVSDAEGAQPSQAPRHRHSSHLLTVSFTIKEHIATAVLCFWSISCLISRLVWNLKHFKGCIFNDEGCLLEEFLMRRKVSVFSRFWWYLSICITCTCHFCSLVFVWSSI